MPRRKQSGQGGAELPLDWSGQTTVEDLVDSFKRSVQPATYRLITGSPDMRTVDEADPSLVLLAHTVLEAAHMTMPTMAIPSLRVDVGKRGRWPRIDTDTMDRWPNALGGSEIPKHVSMSFHETADEIDVTVAVGGVGRVAHMHGLLNDGNVQGTTGVFEVGDSTPAWPVALGAYFAAREDGADRRFELVERIAEAEQQLF